MFIDPWFGAGFVGTSGASKPRRIASLLHPRPELSWPQGALLACATHACPWACAAVTHRFAHHAQDTSCCLCMTPSSPLFSLSRISRVSSVLHRHR